MKVEQGFYTKDLNVYLNRSENLGDTPVYSKEYFMQRFKYYNNSYKIFYAFDGEFTLANGDCERTVKANTLSFASPFEKFTFKPDLNKEFKFIFITLHPSVFTNKSIESTYFRIFENLKNESAYLDIADLGMSVLSDTLGLLADLILKSYSRCHVESVCLSIITQMSMFYDAHHKPDVIARSLPMTIIHYIRKHYTENISYKMITDKFSISAPAINIIVKNETGYTFYQYVNNLLLEEARKMLQKSWDVPASKIAELCGFKTYVAFFKAYKKKYGISPSQETKTDPCLKYWPFKEK